MARTRSGSDALSEGLRSFHSSGEPGFSSHLTAHPGHVVARKLEHKVQVHFSEDSCTVRTLEGLVHARRGDAIITGTGGEHWRVSKERFPQKYRPVETTVPGENGTYVSLRTQILALQMDEEFEVLLADGQSQLLGKPGDWLVDYGDGSLGIVSQAIFPTTYEIIG
jgi:hypothetical protein